MRFLPAPILLAILASVGPAGAADLPDYYPDSFEHWGVINEVLGNERTLVVDGVRVTVKSTLRVYTPRSRFDQIDDLRATMPIGFNGTEPLGEIWVLPPGYEPEGARRVGE